jgi:hypothetical protein
VRGDEKSVLGLVRGDGVTSPSNVGSGTTFNAGVTSCVGGTTTCAFGFGYPLLLVGFTLVGFFFATARWFFFIFLDLGLNYFCNVLH